jgi:acyl-coenzyme A thioesterase PaaI-like protein
MAQAVFLPAQDGRFLATELSRGPWDPQAQHGGAPAALLMRALEALPRPDESLQIARVTYEFMRPVRLGEVDVRVAVVKPGRRVQLLEGSLLDRDGTEVVRARAVQVQPARSAALPEPPHDVPARGPEHGSPDAPPIALRDLTHFGGDAVEIRFVAGAFSEPGPASAWFRLRAPLIEGEEPSPLQRLAAAADFGNGISSVLPWEEWLFINPDLTVYVDRPPVGEWIGLSARTSVADGGVTMAESVLFDRSGRVGRAVQALLVARR